MGLTPSAAIAEVREEWRQALAEDDHLSAELWSTYLVLGELLNSGRIDEECVFEYQDLVARLIELGNEERKRSDQRLAAWIARITASGGGDEQ